MLRNSCMLSKDPTTWPTLEWVLDHEFTSCSFMWFRWWPCWVLPQVTKKSSEQMKKNKKNLCLLYAHSCTICLWTSEGKKNKKTRISLLFDYILLDYHGRHEKYKIPTFVNWMKDFQKPRAITFEGPSKTSLATNRSHCLNQPQKRTATHPSNIKMKFDK